MTPNERGPQQMSGPAPPSWWSIEKTGDDGSFRHRGQCLSGEPMPTQGTESVKGAVAQAQDSVHVRRGTKVASEYYSKDQHLRNSFNILKRWRTGRWSKAPGNDHLFRLGGIQFEVMHYTALISLTQKTNGSKHSIEQNVKNERRSKSLL